MVVVPKKDCAMTKEEWIARCERQYVARTGKEHKNHRGFAEACWEQRDSDDGSPEDAADTDMTYWEDDE
jgi:hypothetical protein